jgi:AcrR family transcriptional regulator
MLDTAIELFRQNGYNGTGFRQVVAESGAPRGSIYHHFPGGKTQLGVEAVEQAGRFIESLIDRKLDRDDVAEGLESMWTWWVEHVRKANLGGCPALAIAVESHPEAPELTAAAAAAFASWIAAYRRGLERAGLPRRDAQPFALLILSALEGATAIARAEGDMKPLQDVGGQVVAALRARLA